MVKVAVFIFVIGVIVSEIPFSVSKKSRKLLHLRDFNKIQTTFTYCFINRFVEIFPFSSSILIK
jgi:hypothetical protein